MIAYFPLDHKGKRWHYESTACTGVESILLRAMCNLVVIDIDQEENLERLPMVELELD
jgi:hypothetical protein